MLIRLTRPEPPPPRTSQRNPRLNVWRPPPSVAIHFPVGTLSPSPADAGAFCTAEGRFGLIQQLPPVLAQGVIFPGQLVGCILHHGSIANYWPESPPPSPELRNGTHGDLPNSAESCTPRHVLRIEWLPVRSCPSQRSSPSLKSGASQSTCWSNNSGIGS